MFRLKCQCGKEHEVAYGIGGTLRCDCGCWIQWAVYPQTYNSSSALNALGQLIYRDPTLPTYHYWPQPQRQPDPLPTIKSSLPIIGFRSWQYYKDRLYSNNRQFGYWKAGANMAVHQHTVRFGLQHHKAPNENCECGIYVLSTMVRLTYGPWGLYAGTEKVDNQVPRIVGAVMGWGKVVAHEPEGWRASHAQIIGLLDLSVVEYERITMEGLARYYEVPLLPSERALKAYANEYGESLAEKIRQRET